MVENVLKGFGVTKKIGVGKALVLADSGIVVKRVKVTDKERELYKFFEARVEFVKATAQMADDLSKRLGNDEIARVIRSHNALVFDNQFEEDIKKQIFDNRICAQWAADVVCSSYVQLFEQMDNEIIAQRAVDFDDIRRRLIEILSRREHIQDEKEEVKRDASEDTYGTVLVAKELRPSVTATLDASALAGIVVENGGETSHAAILAKALGIPTVLGAKGATEVIADGDAVIVDGYSGEVIFRPNKACLKQYKDRIASLVKGEEELLAYKHRKTCTMDGVDVSLYVNIGSVDEVHKISEYNSDGIGLFRTEFLFMNGVTVPTITEQYEAYKKVIMACKDKDITIRTLDIGGDKAVSYLGLEKEVNPFLGLRGVRLCLDRVELFKDQIEAILRASAYGNGNLRIMIPMVTAIEEIREVKSIIENVKISLKQQNVEYDHNIKLGIMVETPAAVIMADVFAKEVDFFSIGTNDLTQYTMAVDRGNEKVSKLFDTFSPAVLRAVKHIVSVANDAGIEVSVCGEAAADPHIIPVLLGLGVRKFSVASSLVLETRKTIGQVNMDCAYNVVDNIMNMTSVEEIKRYGSSL